MKTITKVLSMLLVIVMCASIFGVSAYADAPLKKGVSEEDTVVVGKKPVPVQEEVDSFDSAFPKMKNEAEAPSIEEDAADDGFIVEKKESPLLGFGEVSDPKASISGSEVDYESLDDAIKHAPSGSTIILLDDVTLDHRLVIAKTINIDLDGKELNLADCGLDITGSLSVCYGTIKTEKPALASSNAALTLRDVSTNVKPSANFIPKNYHVEGPEDGMYNVVPGTDVSDNPYYSLTADTYTLKSDGTDGPVSFRVRTEFDKTADEYYLFDGKKYIEIEYEIQDGELYDYYQLTWDFLDSLTAGTTYLFCYHHVKDDDVYQMETSTGQSLTLTVKKGAIDPKTELDLHDRYGDKWYQGDNPLQFVVDPYPGSKNIQISVDGEKLGNLDWYDYHSGYFYLGTSFLQSLDSGWHTLKVTGTGFGNKKNQTRIGECNFYVGPSLVARDTDKHVIGSSRTLKFVCSEPVDRIWVGDKELDGYDDYYTLSKDRKTITLTSKFLNNRTAGNTYTLTVETDSGERISTTFQILTTAQGSASPRTGDEANFALWAALLVMSGAAAVVVLPKLRKHED